MQTKHWLGATVGIVGLVMWAMPAAAAPLTSATTSLRIAASKSSLVEHTHWRGRGYGYYYGGYYPRYGYYGYYPYYGYPDYYYYYPRPYYYGYYAYPRYRHYYYARPYQYRYGHYRRW